MRISLDAHLENGADQDAILSEKAHEFLKATGEKIAADAVVHQGFWP